MSPRLNGEFQTLVFFIIDVWNNERNVHALFDHSRGIERKKQQAIEVYEKDYIVSA